MTVQRDRRKVPLHHRIAVAREIQELLDERLPEGTKRRWTQTSLGDRLSLSQETIRRALNPNGVTEAVAEGIRELLGISLDEMAARRGVEVEYAGNGDPLFRLTQPIDLPPDDDTNARLRRKTVLRLQLRPYNLQESEAQEIVDRQLYARKHSVPLDEDKFAQLCYLNEMEMRGTPVGKLEDEVSLPAPAAALRVADDRRVPKRYKKPAK